jgi:hypothetical protein
MKTSWYSKRDEVLQRLGYADYADYLSSKRWRTIRARVFNRCKGICEVCRIKPAREVHHRSYCLDAMTGKRLDDLVGCCRECLQTAEFENSRKASPRRANLQMVDAPRGSGFALPGICQVCQKNPTGNKGKKALCRRCRRDQRCNPPDWRMANDDSAKVDHHH